MEQVRYPAIRDTLERIRATRTKKSGGALSLLEISVLSHAGYAHLYRVFHGQSLPSRPFLFRICRAMNCTEEEAASIFTSADYRIPDQREIETLFAA